MHRQPITMSCVGYVGKLCEATQMHSSLLCRQIEMKIFCIIATKILRVPIRYVDSAT